MKDNITPPFIAFLYIMGVIIIALFIRQACIHLTKPEPIQIERQIQHDWTSEYLNLTGAEDWIGFGEKIALKIREVEKRVEILEKEAR